MTTIAYRDGVLAGDGRITVGDTVSSESYRKVHRLRDGRLVGFSGDTDDVERLRVAIVKNEEPPELGNIQALLINTDGSIDYYQGSIWQRQRNDPYYAIGTGATLAMIAMDCGEDAVSAVKRATKRDVHSGGKVSKVALKVKK